ncbi:MAG: N-acetylmuramoyl-L-alanine amidase [Johnsonella sp.]|nr:N-acetylmuramoyl-L-alanine amidase [Johnsonella sp.]
MKRRKGIGIIAIILAAALVVTGCKDSKQAGEEQKERVQAKETETTQIISLAAKDLPGGIQSAANKNTAQSQAPTEKAIEFSDVNETVYVNADNLNLRRKPSTNAEIIKKLTRAEALVRTGVSEKWSRVEYQNESAYVAAQYLTKEKPVQETSAAAAAPSFEAASGAQIKLDPSWKYAGNSKINSGAAILYKAENNRKNITVCVNAGHGTKGGSSVKTLCHPDGTPKVTGGTTAAGATTAVAVSTGMTFVDGTTEAAVTLKMAKALKSVLLARGYDVLMIRESDDVQLDNIARTVIANNTSSCHIALHWDSTTSDKGAFYMGVPDVASYRAMEPVASSWQKHEALGASLIQGLKGANVKIFGEGRLPMDLTQTSYSTIASIDIELGDKVSSHSDDTISNLAKGLADGVDHYFGQ